MSSSILNNVDAVFIHWSLQTHLDGHLPTEFFEALVNTGIPVTIWRQDEYRWVAPFVQKAALLNLRFLFSNLDRSAADIAYGPLMDIGCTVVGGLPGYAQSTNVVSTLPLAHRDLSVGYRVNRLGPRFGLEASRKVQAAEALYDVCKLLDKPFDIGFKRLAHDKWAALLSRSSATSGAESGCSVFDLDGTLDGKIREWKARSDNQNKDEWAMYDELIGPLENRVSHRTLGPRIWEAIESGTALILVPGKYRGILNEYEHYEPLYLDGSNSDRIRWLLQNPDEMQPMVERAKGLLKNTDFHYETFVRAVYTAISLSVTSNTAKILRGRAWTATFVTAYQSQSTTRILSLKRNETVRRLVLSNYQTLSVELVRIGRRVRRGIRRAGSVLVRIGRRVRRGL